MSRHQGARPPVIELRGVTRTYPGPPPVRALCPADLVIDAGDYVAVTGPSGSGKSTLLHLLGLLDTPTGGTYLLDGLDTGALPDRDRSALRGRRIGFVFQAFHLLAYRTAEENVQLAQLYNRTPRAQRGAAARDALQRVGLGQRIDALHAGGFTIVVISHDANVAARANRTVAIKDGQLSEPRPASAIAEAGHA